MHAIPRDRSPDSSLALLSEGYLFISKRCQRYQSDAFETRLMLRKAICTTGAEAARMFYHPERFTRKSAMPPTTLMLLQDRGSVQSLDGEAHHHRKQMFMSLMSPESIRKLANLTDDCWQDRLAGWDKLDQVVLHEEVQKILCRAVCHWAGLPLPESKIEQRTAEFAAMIDGAGSIGPRNWKGLMLRRRTEKWARGVIATVRDRTLDVPEGSATFAVAWHRERNGELLSENDAAVELINILRPTVAVARYITFAALALHEYPECREGVRSGDAEYLERFVQEVRRFYPFFPLIAGNVRNEFEWRGRRFAKGEWVLLDLYGTNHDARRWDSPNTFRPERFQTWTENAFDFVPQGGGDHNHGHRCPGEWITIELIKRAATFLAAKLEYQVPSQDLTINLSRIPAIPNSRFVITHVQSVG